MKIEEYALRTGDVIKIPIPEFYADCLELIRSDYYRYNGCVNSVFRMFIETFEHEYTWLNGFLRNVRRYGNKPALIDPSRDQTWTYKQLDEECNQLANALKEDTKVLILSKRK